MSCAKLKKELQRPRYVLQFGPRTECSKLRDLFLYSVSVTIYQYR